MDISKLKGQLGYRDIVSVDQALEKTVQWYAENPIPPEGEAEQNLGDPFDYAYEDAFIEHFEKHKQAFAKDCSNLPNVKVVWKHPYQ